MKALGFLLLTLAMNASTARADEQPEPQPDPVAFTIATFSPKIYLFDQAGQSCKAQIMNPFGPADMAASKLVFGALKLNWAGPSALQLDYMKIVLTSAQIAGGTQTLFFAGQDLSFLWQGSPGLVELYPQDANQTTAPACNFEAGGVNLADKSVPATGHGQITVHATANVDDVLTPLDAKVDFDFEAAH